MPDDCLRPMEEADLPQVMRMEKDTFSDPWNESFFRTCLEVSACWVLEQPGDICAYAVMSVEATQAHILNLCVDFEFRRRGLGRRLLTHLLDQAHRNGALVAFLEVRPSNRSAIQLYQSMGFRPRGVSKGYYPKPRGSEDALILVTRL